MPHPSAILASPTSESYSRAKDEMFVHTDTSWAPWYVVEADDKRRARLNCIAHLLTKIPYEDTAPARIKIPKRQPDQGYVRPSRDTYTYVPDHAAAIMEGIPGRR